MTGAGATPVISVIVPTLGEAPVLSEALTRLDRQHDASPFEVLVCLDCEALDERFIPAGLGYPLRIIERRGRGASAARNAGWQRAHGELVLFLGDDILAEPGLLAAHERAHRRRPEERTGVLGHVRWADSLPTTSLMVWLERGVQFDYGTISGREAGWGRFYTANASVKRTLLERHGGFDAERFPFLYEDLELAYRLRREAGFELDFESEARAEHMHPPTLDGWRRRIRLIAAAERRLVELHPELEPELRRRFAAAASKPPASGRGRALTPHLGPGFPLLGRRAHASADLWFRQQLAADFERGWSESGSDG